MTVNEYRHHAADCLRIAGDVADAQNKMQLIAMAQAWLKRAQKAEEGWVPKSGWKTAAAQ